MQFEIVARCPDTGARAGRLTLPHGEVLTPLFMPVGTQATVKSLAPAELEALGAHVVLANTYHLALRPGPDVVAALGGLHKFMGWPHNLLTDSGGFQVFSLGHLRRVDADGVSFRSHIDGSEQRLTPESAVAIQEQLGADIIMAFDECAPSDADEEHHRQAMVRTSRWAARCRQAQTRRDQSLFGIVQGGLFPYLRRQSAETLVAMDFPGYAVGGLSLGEPKAQMWRVLEATTCHLPLDKPRYLMGVGSPEDLFEAVARGVDMMDAVLPTRVARNGAFFTRRGRRNIRNAAFRTMDAPVEEGCDCYTCTHFSAAYVHHLFRCEELLAYRLASIHNLRFAVSLMEEVRRAIVAGRFAQLREEFLAGYQATDEGVRLEQKRRWEASHGR
ncbi:MAG: tRNA guanosine(34) transglycosylase Tgt [Bacteroidetes bacterium]|nr:tRNA guanosine(34) transglycosylase Tgt [Bacteroidota bacterium]MCL5025034.1 tRNA guanosine(34) transglycosylase Tgt [Chloroflexota bacterium]